MGWSPMNFTELTALACDIDILTLVMVNLERSHLKGHALSPIPYQYPQTPYTHLDANGIKVHGYIDPSKHTH